MYKNKMAGMRCQLLHKLDTCTLSGFAYQQGVLSRFYLNAQIMKDVTRVNWIEYLTMIQSVYELGIDILFLSPVWLLFTYKISTSQFKII